MMPFLRTVLASSLFGLAAPLLAHVDSKTGESALDAALDVARVAMDDDPGWFRNVTPAPASTRTFTRAATRGVEAARLGAWSPVDDWPVLPVHAALLPNGKVLAWDATPDDFGEDVHTAERYETRVTVWDPETNTHLRANNDTDTDLFCAGSAHLWDGRVLFAGGDGGRDGKNGPLSNSNLYDPWTNTWSRTDDMIAPRWYSSVAALGTGEMLTFGGAYTPTPVAEVFGFDKRWRGLPIRTQYTFSGDYSWLQATSAGDVLYFGPHDTLSRLDPRGEGSWTPGGRRDGEGYRSYGAYAMYDIDRVLVAGGGESLASAVVVDTTSATAVPTNAMTHGRRQHNLTVLADGSVLATGGNRTGANFIDLAGGVFEPERWDPTSGTWTSLAPATIDRQYHSIALLLADGRVLTGGGGYCPLCSELGYHEQNVEIFSPPYLFAADGGEAVRPRVIDVPVTASYAERFVVRTPDATRIRRAHLIKPGSVTHSQNQEQRLVPLEFVASADRLSIRAPANRDLAPPGHYLLFLVDEAGVPSVGKMVQIGQPLIGPSEVVRNRLQANRPDFYTLEGKGTHRLSVSVSGADGDLDLFVGAGRVPATDAGDPSGFADCLIADDAGGGRRCDVSGDGDTTWYVGVRGAAGTEYALVAELGDLVTTPVPATAVSTLDPASRVNALVAGNVTERTVTLSWSAPAGIADVHGYEIWRDGMLIAHQRSRTFTEPSLAPRTSYRYHVVAVRADLVRGLPSRTLVVTTEATTGSYEDRYSPYIPSRPTGLRHVRYSSSAAELFWESSFDNGSVVAYEVWRDGERRGTSGGLSFFDDALEADTDHSWYVIAVDDLGNRSAPSAPVGTAMIAPVDPPARPDPDGGTNQGPGYGPGYGQGYGPGYGNGIGNGAGEGIGNGVEGVGNGGEDPGDSAGEDTGDVAAPKDVVDTDPAPDGEPDTREPDESTPIATSARRGGGGAAGFVLLLAPALLVACRHRRKASGERRHRALVAGFLAVLVSACNGSEPPSADRADEPLVPVAPVVENPSVPGPSEPPVTLEPSEPPSMPEPPVVPAPLATPGSDSPPTLPVDPDAGTETEVGTGMSDTPLVPAGTGMGTDMGASAGAISPDPGVISDAPLYVGRPWQRTAALGQDALDALGLHAMRRRVAEVAAELGLHDAGSVERECPGGGLAQATSTVTPRRVERRHAFSACVLADGTMLDGDHDVVRRDDGDDDSVKTELEEYYAIASSSTDGRLEVGGTLTEAVTGRRPDACGLVQQETVLRIDVPAMVVGNVEIRGLAIEDITNARIVIADDGVSCGTQVTELAFSDSARVTDHAGGGRGFTIGVNRTGSILRDEDGGTRSSGRDLRIRIYHAGDDASLDLSPRFGTADGVTVTIDNHPGRVDFDDVWRFLRG